MYIAGVFWTKTCIWYVLEFCRFIYILDNSVLNRLLLYILQNKNGLKESSSSEQPPASTTTTTISTPPTMVSSEKFDNATAFFPTSRPPPKWMLPQPSLPISQPVKSAKYNASGGVPGSQNTTDSDSSDDQSTSHTVSRIFRENDIIEYSAPFYFYF